jgi:hypothetical protein
MMDKYRILQSFLSSYQVSTGRKYQVIVVQVLVQLFDKISKSQQGVYIKLMIYKLCCVFII